MPVNNNCFSSVLLQKAPVRHLVRSFTNGRIAQTYLFAGKESTGRRTTALAFAALLQCQNPTTGGDGSVDSCQNCDSCRRIAAGTHPDVNLITPDGNEIRIDQVREMQAMASLKPGVGRWQIFILDPAERLNVSSANSLLKIFEEAPPHAVFILIARDTGSVLPTVLSRSEIVRFAVPSHQQARAEIMRACALSEAQAALCYSLSEGRFGRSLEFALNFHELSFNSGISQSHTDFLIQTESLSQLLQAEFAAVENLDRALRVAGQIDQKVYFPLQAARKSFCRSLVLNTGLPAAFALLFSENLTERLNSAISVMKKSFDPLLLEAKKSYPSALIKEIEGQFSAAIERWAGSQLEEFFLCLLNWYADALIVACKADETLLLNLDRKEDIITLAKVEGIELLRSRIELLEKSVELQRRYVQPLLILENLLTQIGGPEA
ncbi:MAG: DNA polymerase III subunit delta' [Candidatus Riflebacteria bacterium]|nr:DNA polymerase III subunit delta' [Candidatus Riflebacteria bacterium]